MKFFDRNRLLEIGSFVSFASRVMLANLASSKASYVGREPRWIVDDEETTSTAVQHTHDNTAS